MQGIKWKLIFEKQVLEYICSCFDDIVNGYEQYLCSSGKSERDIRNHVDENGCSTEVEKLRTNGGPCLHKISIFD